MIDSDTALSRCEDLIAMARRMGADAADAVMRADASEGVEIRLGKLESVDRSESESIGLRVFMGQRSASIHTSDFSPEAFEALAERALAMARIAPEDPYAGLAPQDRLFSGEMPDLDLLDARECPPEQLRERARSLPSPRRGGTGTGMAMAETAQRKRKCT